MRRGGEPGGDPCVEGTSMLSVAVPPSVTTRSAAGWGVHVGVVCTLVGDGGRDPVITLRPLLLSVVVLVVAAAAILALNSNSCTSDRRTCSLNSLYRSAARSNKPCW